MAFDVTDYGADGSDATEDTDGIKDALNAASAAGGGVVLMPAGIFLIDELLDVPSNVERVLTLVGN